MGTLINKIKNLIIKSNSVTVVSDASSINFTGAGATVTNVGNDVTVNITGGGPSVPSASTNLFNYYNFI